ncbi:terminase family protein [Loktanella sp. F6476L]|uniref:DNA-packaging protein n=1 Tax=Loktanella sp. F6476L TaxID=2926405 RepID=UPI001FF3F233|nr:terminase family protein [Loktanella sp. F6476L]MCK0121651.1 terminase family protein [Loktanella sp. F6476L]
MVQRTFLESLTPDQIEALPYLFDFWAMPHQRPPAGDWRTWVIMGGRGAGKTRAGAEWIRSIAEGPTPTAAGRARRIAVVGETVDQTREVMIFGESGILAVSPPDRKPKWIAGRKMLEWPNGATAHVFSAHDPDALRGPQFDALWADEVAKWKNGEDAWDMLQFSLRLGDCPQACVTTTPRNVPVLKGILERPSTVVTHAPTEANAANLAEGFLEEVQSRYAGTRLGRQELEGVLLADAEGAMWTTEMIVEAVIDDLPEMDRIVVAVDPPVTHKGNSDACGIIVAGAVTQGPVHTWKAYVLADLTVHTESPTEWAKMAIAAVDRFDAQRLVAEVNQGGDMVKTIIQGIDPLVPYHAVRAHKGKAARAEPVAALYEQGRVSHVRGLGALEDQMCLMTHQGFVGSGSPDRVDALVWALRDLVIDPAYGWRAPRVRTLG